MHTSFVEYAHQLCDINQWQAASTKAFTHQSLRVFVDTVM